MKAKIQLNRFPLVDLDLLAQVVRNSPHEEDTGRKRAEIGVLFITMHKDDREQVFRFISRIERKMLRDRKEAMGR